MKIDHIGIAVRSLDKALEFYRDALGVAPVHRAVVKHEKVEAAVLPAGDGRLELLEPTSRDSVIARFIARRGEGLHHVAVQVEDVEAAARAEIRSAPGCRQGPDRCRGVQVRVRPSEGNLGGITGTCAAGHRASRPRVNAQAIPVRTRDPSMCPAPELLQRASGDVATGMVRGSFKLGILSVKASMIRQRLRRFPASHSPVREFCTLPFRWRAAWEEACRPW